MKVIYYKQTRYSWVIPTLIGLVCLGCETSPSNKSIDTAGIHNVIIPRDNRNVSMISLIANPKTYNGKLITIVGYLKIRFESVAIYFHREDFDLNIHANGIWIDLPRQDISNTHYKTLSERYVRVTGIFDMNNNGHNGDYNGSITKIVSIDTLGTPH